ncbi:MAG: MFS transporter [Alphaproteobacteria bacterium]|nr:MFS transporter [Alphaproteobacteria bacterium]MCW5739931.1 MFS transporter [Alphaproteobacteria bacterium]
MWRQPTGFWPLFVTDLIVRVGYQMAKSPVLPLLAAALGANKVAIGVIVGVSTLTGTVFKPFVGALSDRWGRKIWFFTALFLFAAFPFLYRFVQTPDQLMLLRILHGSATAIFGPVTLAIVAEFDRHNRATRLGIFEMARGAGHLIAPAVTGILLAATDASTVFTVVGLLSCAAMVPAVFVPFDSGRIEPIRRRGVLRQLAEGFRHAGGRTEIWGVGALEFAVYGSLYSLKAFLPIFALQAGYGVWAAGLFFTLQESAHLLVRPFGGRTADRHGASPTIALGMMAIGTALILLPYAPGATALLVLAVLVGVGQGFTFPATVSVISNAISADHIGLGLGVYGALRNLGKVAGPVVIGTLLEYLPANAVFPGLGAIALVICVALAVSYVQRRRLRLGS